MCRRYRRSVISIWGYTWKTEKWFDLRHIEVLFNFKIIPEDSNSINCLLAQTSWWSSKFSIYFKDIFKFNHWLESLFVSLCTEKLLYLSSFLNVHLLNFCRMFHYINHCLNFRFDFLQHLFRNLYLIK